ncbi:MAG: NAAT family transporter [Burkholderiales bacterium]|nr:NAAT family transporter [Burkholderiales bacterium]
MAEYAKFLVALLGILNPLGAMPIFASLTAGMSDEDRRRIARIASVSVALVLSIAALAGETMLAFFGIGIASFKVGGAILLLLIAISMMHGSPTREKQTPEEAHEAESKESIAVVPLAIPMLSGPGAISTTIIFSTQHPASITRTGLVIACCLVAALATWLALRAAVPAANRLGQTGINIVMRLMGLILAAVAVEFFASGMLDLFPGLR